MVFIILCDIPNSVMSTSVLLDPNCEKCQNLLFSTSDSAFDTFDFILLFDNIFLAYVR